MDALTDQIRVSQDEIDELIDEVREEAFAEARIILKNRLVQAILDRALSIPPEDGNRGGFISNRAAKLQPIAAKLRPLATELPPIAAEIPSIAAELRPTAAKLPSLVAELPSMAAGLPSMAAGLPSLAAEHRPKIAEPHLTATEPRLAASESQPAAAKPQTATEPRLAASESHPTVAMLPTAVEPLESRPAAVEHHPPDNESESKERILQEIEAIRKKIAENDRFLSGGSVPPGQPGTPASASPEPQPESPALGSHASSVQTPAAPELGYYVYCIVQNDSRLSHQETGIIPSGAGLPEHGIDLAYPVYTIAQQGLAAVVSQVSLDEFGQAELEANLTDLQWLESKVRVHQAVLEAVLASRVCVPMRLCTIYRDEQRVQELMTQHYADFVATLDRLHGKQEWSVKVYCDSQALASKVGEVSDRVKELAAQIKGKSGGAAYFLKKKLEQAIAEEVERIGDETAQHSLDCLAGHAEAATTHSLQDKETTQRQDDMLLNAAYLVPDDQRAAFQVELENLQNTYGARGFSFEMTGPWPPYNFATINLEKVSVE